MTFEHPMHDVQLPSDRQPTTSAPAVPARELKRVSSDELIGPAREVLIRHAGCDYRLRITRQGKLILTK
jgi:hemin uptake protein HemP